MQIFACLPLRNRGLKGVWAVILVRKSSLGAWILIGENASLYVLEIQKNVDRQFTRDTSNDRARQRVSKLGKKENQKVQYEKKINKSWTMFHRRLSLSDIKIPLCKKYNRLQDFISPENIS